MPDGRRKSIQPMGERLPDGNEQNLQQFVNQSTWDSLPVRRRIAQRTLPLISPDAWAVDDVSSPRDGRMSVAVAHQYCGALASRPTAQVAVSVHAVSDTASCPLSGSCSCPRNGRMTPDDGRRPGYRRRSDTGRSGAWLWTSSTSWPGGNGAAGGGRCRLRAERRLLRGLERAGHRLCCGGSFGCDGPPARRPAHRPGVVRKGPQAAAPLPAQAVLGGCAAGRGTPGPVRFSRHQRRTRTPGPTRGSPRASPST